MRAISRAAFLRLRHFWQKGFYDRKRKEIVTGKAPIGGSRGQKPCQGTQGTDTAADTGRRYFGESISAVSANDFRAIGEFFMRGFGIDTMKFGRSGQPGCFSFFPKGALTHHLQSRRWYPSRWSGSCALPEASTGRFSREGRQCRRPSFCRHYLCSRRICCPQGLMLSASIRQLCCQPAACGNLPPAALPQLWVSLRRHPFSFSQKETKTKGR